VFVTADHEFVDDLADSGFKTHAGVVWVPTTLDREQREAWVELCTDAISAQAKEKVRFGMRGLVLYSAQTGIQVWDGDTNYLVISWARMIQGP
jgi:hypothetical protein